MSAQTKDEREYAEWLEAWKIRIFGSVAAYNFSLPNRELEKTGEVNEYGRDMWATREGLAHKIGRDILAAKATP